MDNSVSGINLKIGADLSDLKKKLGEVGSTVESELGPAKDTTKDLNENFKNSATNAAKTAVSAAAIAVSLGKVGKALTGFTKGILEDALKVNPATQEKIDSVKQAFDDMKIALGESLIPLIDQWAPKLTGTLDSITGWIKDNPEAAQNIMLAVAAIGALSSAASLAVPALMLFNISLSPISGTAIAVAAAIGGLALIVGMLIDKSDELTTHTAATAESIESMDTASQSLVQNGFGDLEIWDRELFTNDEGKLGYWSDIAGWDGLPIFVEVQQDAAEALSTTTDAVTDQADAMDTMTESAETTVSTADQVNEILTNMQTTMEGLSDTAGGDLVTNLEQVNEVLDSEGFKELAQNPVPEETVNSYQALADALGSANAAINGSDEGTGMSTALDGLPAKFDNVKTAAEKLAAYLSTEFVDAIQTMLSIVCVTSTDEEGNIDAGGGNTMYNAFGSVFGLFQDLLATSMLLADHWESEFISASILMRDEAGTATGIIEGLGTAADTAAQQFGELARQIFIVVDAYLALQAVKGGSSRGGGKTGKPFESTRASGGPVLSGSTYLVGEQGPELFTPNVTGTIIPNYALHNGEGQTINVIFEGQVIGDEHTISAYVTKAVNKGIRSAVYAGS
ncbi:MAG: hypothetical protein IJI07_01280 [Flexilinea sp.]|nr:hypothetical protein [Flexilinea sp.]